MRAGPERSARGALKRGLGRPGTERLREPIIPFVARTLDPSRRLWTRRRFLGGLTGTAAAVTALDPVVEPYLVDTTHHEVPLTRLPRELDGLRIAFLTDMHRGELTSDATIARAVRRALAFAPDLVVLGGDYTRWKPADAEVCAGLLASLQPRLGLVGCLGNHDYVDPDRVTERFERITGARMLRNGSVLAAPGLRIAGIEDTWRGIPHPTKALKNHRPDEALIFLTHNPVGVKMVEERPALVLAGHTHGGQIRVPGMKPHYPPGMDGFGQIEGWGTYGAARLYISRGVGQTAFALRWNCPPEVTCFTLRPA